MEYSMKKLNAFTMAEILLSLTIIGVVAAITLPSLTGNINERTWNTQRKALYARFSQAIALMPALNGYGTLTEGDSSTSAVDTAAETFITDGLAKVMKINNICDNEHLADCGIPTKITTLGGLSWELPNRMQHFNDIMTGSNANEADKMDLLDTKAAAFETQNGESIIVYYQPNCVGSLNENGGGNGGTFIANKVCANFVYDLNGNKGPNTVGKDIGFITAMYPSDVKVVAPFPAVSPLSGTYAVKPSGDGDISASKACSNFDAEYRLPNVDELASMVVNANLILGSGSNTIKTGYYWSSSPVPNLKTQNNQWSSWGGGLDNYNPANTFKVWCIKR